MHTLTGVEPGMSHHYYEIMRADSSSAATVEYYKQLAIQYHECFEHINDWRVPFMRWGVTRRATAATTSSGLYSDRWNTICNTNASAISVKTRSLWTLPSSPLPLTSRKWLQKGEKCPISSIVKTSWSLYTELMRPNAAASASQGVFSRKKPHRKKCSPMQRLGCKKRGCAYFEVNPES